MLRSTVVSSSTPEAAFVHIQPWAFINGYAYVIESKGKRRVRYECIFHSRTGRKTRNTRKTLEEDRIRTGTHTRGMNCPAAILVSKYKKQGDQWVLHYAQKGHNHAPSPDPFLLEPHVSRRPGRQQALALAATHRGIVTFTESKKMLKRLGLQIDSTTFYNLQRKEMIGQLSDQEEARMLLQHLEGKNVHVAIDEEYILDAAGNRIDRVIRCIAWWTQEQIRQARRFVSDMVAETDATFNTNTKRLLLQSVIGIDNTGKTFSFLHSFSLNEAARTFEFLMKIWETHFFYDCPGPAVIAGDFSKGLTAAIARKAAQDAKEADEIETKLIAKGKEKEIQQETSLDEFDYPLPTALEARPEYEADSQTIIVDWVRDVEPIVVGPHLDTIILQFCEWHAAQAIQRRLIAKGYRKERRDELVNIIWSWIKAPDPEALEVARTKLILNLRVDEKEYLVNYYQPKERQFCRAYTSFYRNLGVYSTQRVEGSHPIVKSNLNKNLSVSEAVMRICEHLESLPADYEYRINRDRIYEPRLIDQEFFKLAIRRITTYALNLCAPELLRAKIILDELEEASKDFEFDIEKGC